MINKFFFIAIAIVLISSTSFAQNDVENFFNSTRHGRYTQALNDVSKISDLKLQNELRNYLSILKNEKIIFANTYDNSRDSISRSFNMFLINKSLLVYTKNGNTVEAFQLLEKSQILAKKRKDTILICQALKYKLEIYERFHITIGDKTYKYTINEYKKHAYDNFEKNLALLYEFRITQRFNPDNTDLSTKFYNLVRKNIDSLNSPLYDSKLWLTSFIHHQKHTKNYDSCAYYINLALHKLKKNHGYFEKERLLATKINLAALENNNGNPEVALKILDSIVLEPNDHFYGLLQKYIYINRANSYNDLGNVVESLRAENLYYLSEIVANQANYVQMISLYQSEKKESENIALKADNLEIENKQKESEAKRKQSQNIAIGLAGSLALGSIIAFLLFKNTKRKQKLAEQDKEIESQKLAAVLKEQELTAIDAMIAGQEKERQRIANDLHDDLGGLMATVKLHFNALKDKQSTDLFEKTNLLIDEAYQKVRTIAHAKNSGVIAKQGLLKSINEMAEKISATNTITIEVVDHGLENRLENSLELTIFRIIQELITNIIKHANASEATIHITNHDDSLNIMVEDNGKGFNPTQITKTKKGMGISNIDKRIEHLDGKMTIESEHNKGTTVIIDIPL